MLIAPDVGQVIGELEPQIERRGGGQRPLGFRAIREEMARGHPRALDAELARLDHRHIKEVADQPVHPPRGANDALDRFENQGLTLCPSPERRRCHGDGGERVPQVMSDDAEHLVPTLGGVQCRLVEAAVFDGERRTLCERLGHPKIVRFVRARRIARDEDEHTAELAADEKR